MNTTDIQRKIIESAINKAIQIIESEYNSKVSIFEYLEKIEKEMLYKAPVTEIYQDYVMFCSDKNLLPVGRVKFAKDMIKCGFKIKYIKENGQVARCFDIDSEEA